MSRDDDRTPALDAAARRLALTHTELSENVLALAFAYLDLECSESTKAPTVTDGRNPSVPRRVRRMGTRADRSQLDRALYDGLDAAHLTAEPPRPHDDALRVLTRFRTQSSTTATASADPATVVSAPAAALEALEAFAVNAMPALLHLDDSARDDALRMLAGYLRVLRADLAAQAADNVQSARAALLLPLVLAVLLTLHARRTAADEFTRLVSSLESDNRPPPPTLEALTTSTLTAAPPAPARPVPGARRAVLVTAG